jgi:hypothetical protein
MTPTLPNLSEVKAIRELLTTIRSQVCGYVDCLAEPWKTHFNALKQRYDEALGALPPTDQVPAAISAGKGLEAFFSCLMSANALAGMLGSEVRTLQGTVASSMNSAVETAVAQRIASGLLFPKEVLDGRVAAEVAAKQTSGELVLKTTVTQLCSEAKAAGMAEGEAKIREEVAKTEAANKNIATRKGLLQTAGLPVPEAAFENILGGTEDEFATVRTTAEARIAGLQKKGIALNSKSPLLAKVYLPKDQWEIFESLAQETIRGGTPLAPPPGGPANGNPGPMIV